MTATGTQINLDNDVIGSWDEGAPDPMNFQKLIPCPKCGAKYTIDKIRMGPCIISFTSKQYQAMCISCWHKAKKARTEMKALDNWNNATVSCQLKKIRLEKGLLVKDVAERSGLDHERISRIERNVVIPTLEDRKVLAKALDVDMRYL